MSDSEFIFTLLYLLLCFGLIYPPSEFVGIGLTIDQLFSSYLVAESIEFVQHHIKRINLTLLLHSFLPQLYIIFIQFVADEEKEDERNADNEFTPLQVLWMGFRVFAGLQPLLAFGIIYYWHKNDWKNHPIPKCLVKFTNDTNFLNWRAVAESVNAEYRR
jgi:hypothetical protein